MFMVSLALSDTGVIEGAIHEPCRLPLLLQVSSLE